MSTIFWTIVSIGEHRRSPGAGWGVACAPAAPPCPAAALLAPRCLPRGRHGLSPPCPAGRTPAAAAPCLAAHYKSARPSPRTPPPPLAVLVKYVLVMLLADDHGEGEVRQLAPAAGRPLPPPLPTPAGGVMALYSVICRACGVRSVAKAHETDHSLAKFGTTGAQGGAAASPSGAPAPRWRVIRGSGRTAKAVAGACAGGRSLLWQVPPTCSSARL